MTMLDSAITEILPWQLPYWRNLQAAISEGRLPHALLLSGNRGIGKFRFARSLAAALLCQSPRQGYACGGCNACHLQTVGNHPDLHLIEPEEKGKAIKVEVIRKLIEDNGLTPHLSDIKINIIRDADRMNISASNSLLKTLEEPSPNSLIILVSSRTDLLSPTIKSRCQNIKFTPPETEQALQWLKMQNLTADADVLLSLASGSPLTALELHQQEALQFRDEMIAALLDISQGRADPVKIAASWEKRDINLVLQWLTIWVIDLIRLKYHDSKSLLSNSDKLDKLTALSRLFSVHDLFGFYEKFLQSSRLVDRQMNRTLLLESLLLPWTVTQQN